MSNLQYANLGKKLEEITTVWSYCGRSERVEGDGWESAKRK